MASIPERRPEERPAMAKNEQNAGSGDSAEIKVWRCTVCGYLCARTGPPETCPVCKVSRERFEQFEFH